VSETAAILLSRQPLRPVNQTPWVIRTRQAVDWISEQGHTLLSSVGMQTWELITALGSLYGIPMRVYVPSADPETFESRCEKLRHDLELSDRLVEFVAVVSEACRSEKELREKRDHMLIAGAEVLVPVSVRSGGHMQKALQQPGKFVCTDFTVSYERRPAPLAYRIDATAVNPVLKDVGQNFFTHWTRGVSRSWPEERAIDFYRAILNSDDWPRGALQTLSRIVSTRRIIASSRHMPGNERTVSFSSLSPFEVIPLMRWRARYAEMSFEPYGIGIEREAALKLGIKPVIYDQPRTLAVEDRWRYQSSGKLTDWRDECEYRHRGDFDLAQLKPDKLVLFCRYRHEAARLERVTGIRAIWFEG
jgi:hypothetical protein